jgi:FkbM family methyltransferase
MTDQKANMNFRRASKILLANVVPRSTYLAVNARIAARDIASKRRYVPEIDSVPRFVRAGDTVVDVGGNHGLYAFHLSRLVGPSGRVHTFEPVPMNLGILRHTVKSLGLSNVTVHPAGCGDKPGKTSFYVLSDHGIPQLGWPRRQEAAGQKFQCDIVRLDDVIAARISFLKIDVDGAELLVLRGAQRILRESHPVILFEAGGYTSDFGYEQQAVFDFLATFGYRFFSGGFSSKALEPREGFSVAEDYFALPESVAATLQQPLESTKVR